MTNSTISPSKSIIKHNLNTTKYWNDNDNSHHIPFQAKSNSHPIPNQNYSSEPNGTLIYASMIWTSVGFSIDYNETIIRIL